MTDLTAPAAAGAQPAASPLTLCYTLYARSYCHLCDDMLAGLLALQSAQLRCQVEVVDVDADPALLERFDELVPVLFGDLSQPELCHYFLDEAAVRQDMATRAAARHNAGVTN